MTLAHLANNKNNARAGRPLVSKIHTNNALIPNLSPIQSLRSSVILTAWSL